MIIYLYIRTYLITSSQNRYIDFNFCSDIPTYCPDHHRGLVVDKHNCIIYAGEDENDKEWVIKNCINCPFYF